MEIQSACWPERSYRYYYASDTRILLRAIAYTIYMPQSREDLICLAWLAEQARRYEGGANEH